MRPATPLLETMVWCAAHLPLSEPASSLRTLALRPPALANPPKWLDLGAKGWEDAVAFVVANRRHLLEAHPTRHEGRVLVYAPDENLADGAARMATNGFFDNDNCPPWDTWIEHREGLLYTWIPQPFETLAQDGIDINPEECIRWADDSYASKALVDDQLQELRKLRKTMGPAKKRSEDIVREMRDEE